MLECLFGKIPTLPFHLTCCPFTVTDVSFSSVDGFKVDYLGLKPDFCRDDTAWLVMSESSLVYRSLSQKLTLPLPYQIDAW